MAEKKNTVKINKKHGGKEFNSFFRFIGQVSKFKKYSNGDHEEMPFFDEIPTRSMKQMRVLQFDLNTAKHNNLKIELFGMERELAYISNKKEHTTQSIKWADRFDKKKYPNESYHLMDTEWDKTETLAENLVEGAWVEVKGKYEFDSFVKDDGVEVLTVKRYVNSIEPIESGKEVNHGGKKFAYVTDFDSPDFREVNYFNAQIGIKSTYQDEITKNTKVNGVFLSYDKERSKPKDVELMVYYKESEKTPLADAFTRLNKYDFIEVIGVDNNRPEFSEIDEVVVDEDDIFADVDEQVTRRTSAISGNRRGLEITSLVTGSYMKEMLTESEIEKHGVIVESRNDGNPFLDTDIEEDDLPF